MENFAFTNHQDRCVPLLHEITTTY